MLDYLRITQTKGTSQSTPYSFRSGKGHDTHKQYLSNYYLINTHIKENKI